MQLRNPFRSTNATDPRAEADELVVAGRVVDAVDLLAGVNRRAPDAALELRLIELRRDAAREYPSGPGRSPWPPAYDDPWPDLAGALPELAARDVGVEQLGGAVAHHGALLVRGLLDSAQVARAIEVIHRVQAARDRRVDDDAWYHPVDTGRPMHEALRQMVADQGGVWLADSPAGTAAVLDELADAGVVELIARHLGERPFFSLQKSTLRRSIPKVKLVAWHQDGSFLDPDVRTMNTWVALSRCGGSYPSPGLEVVPRRVPDVLAVDGELTPHSVAPALVDEIAADTPTICPEFAPGDALMFDERFLHRTHLTAGMTEDRLALECWFFAPSHPSSDYVPFLV